MTIWRAGNFTGGIYQEAVVCARFYSCEVGNLKRCKDLFVVGTVCRPAIVTRAFAKVGRSCWSEISWLIYSDNCGQRGMLGLGIGLGINAHVEHDNLLFRLPSYCCVCSNLHSSFFALHSTRIPYAIPPPASLISLNRAQSHFPLESNHFYGFSLSLPSSFSHSLLRNFSGSLKINKKSKSNLKRKTFFLFLFLRSPSDFDLHKHTHTHTHTHLVSTTLESVSAIIFYRIISS